MNTPDTGPSVRPPSDAVRGRARSAVMSQVGGGGAASDDGADMATFDRDGFDDAPRQLKKRWIGVAAGLAAAAVGAAIVLGPGLGGDDLGISPAAPTDEASSTQEVPQIPFEGTIGVVAQQCLDEATQEIEAFAASEVESEPDPELTSAQNSNYQRTLAAGPLQIIASHNEPTLGFAVLANSAAEVRCYGTTEAGLLGRETRFSPPVAPLDGIHIEGLIDLDEANTLASGRVAEDVARVTITTDDQKIYEAYVQDGYYSALLAGVDLEAPTYALTRSDASLETASGDGALTQLPPEEFAQFCTTYANDPESRDSNDEAQATDSDDPMVVVAHHIHDAYQFVVAKNQTMETQCVLGSNEQIDGAEPSVSEKPQILRMDSRSEINDDGRAVEVGQLADNVTALALNTPDGPAVADVTGGYYSVLLSRSYRNDELSYDVTFDDGSTETVTSP